MLRFIDEIELSCLEFSGASCLKMTSGIRFMGRTEYETPLISICRLGFIRSRL